MPRTSFIFQLSGQLRHSQLYDCDQGLPVYQHICLVYLDAGICIIFTHDAKYWLRPNGKNHLQLFTLLVHRRRLLCRSYFYKNPWNIPYPIHLTCLHTHLYEWFNDKHTPKHTHIWEYLHIHVWQKFHHAVVVVAAFSC